jgi:hypothetical protein
MVTISTLESFNCERFVEKQIWRPYLIDTAHLESESGVSPGVSFSFFLAGSTSKPGLAICNS